MTATQMYSYECEHGHLAMNAKPLEQCPVYRHGKPCDGQLTRVGRGSRSGHGKLGP